MPAVTTALCTSLFVIRSVDSVVLILSSVDENGVRRLEPIHTRASLNDMADAEGGPSTDSSNAPINIKVSSSTRVERPHREG